METVITPMRRCAQIKQIIRLSTCTHPNKSCVTYLEINGGWVVFCTDCDKVCARDE